MMVAILEFDAPLMSFGAPMIDQRGVIQDWPALSMLTGLIANALGWERTQYARLESLQARLRYAARRDRAGHALQDYQTVDLGQPHLIAKTHGWTTRGKVAERKGAFSTGTHIRYRDYFAGAFYTVALTLVGDGEPSMDQLIAALERPARPLFLGRKPCLPSRRILRTTVDAPNPLAALQAHPPIESADPDRPIWFSLEAGAAEPDNAHWLTTTTDTRDWANQIHGGERQIYQVAHAWPAEDAHG